MPQLTLSFLSTRPLSDMRGFSIPVTDSTTKKARSPRSQVRGLNDESLQSDIHQSTGVRVSGISPRPDAVAKAAKDGEVRLHPIKSSSDRIKKRSLRRALRRAEREGGALYKGRALLQWSPPYEPTMLLAPRKPRPRCHDRIKLVHWNCGGYSQALQLEWHTWLQKDPALGIFILAETHWSFSIEFQSQGWTMVHSGVEGKKGAGVMVGIRSDLLDAGTLKWHEVEPGRLLHVRCNLQKQPYDILALYQHATARVAADKLEELRRKRNRLWKLLDGTIAGFPFRSSLIIAGDFNMVLSPLAEVAGPGIKPGSDVAWLLEEREEVMNILKSRRLTALNTWSKPAVTYKHPNGESQIDYVIVRKQSADLEAKQCRPTKTPLAGWRSAGHDPVVASIQLNWRPWQQSVSASKESKIDSPTVEQVTNQEYVDLRNLQLAVKAHRDVPRRLFMKPPPKDVSAQVKDLWQKHAEGTLVKAPEGSHQTQQDDDSRRYLKREMCRLARQRKREVLLQAIDWVSEAQSAGDLHAQYQLIRRICPKTFRRKICMRSEQGHLMNNAAECDALAAYAKALFDDVPFEPPELLPLPSEWFTSEAWQQSLKQLNSHKAVPKFSASVQCWKTYATELTPTLQKIAHDTVCSAQPYIPDFWTRVQLAWLPKPGKAPSSPAQLRSIGLMGPDTKAFLMILKRQANPWVQQALATVPQYAYRQLASTMDPILRSTKHCTTVRRILANYVEDHTAKILNRTDQELLGGLMVGIDLSKAFDYLGYAEMYKARQDTGMPEHLSRILLHVHIRTTLHVEHGGFSREIKMKRGLRQGCGVAPMIYACWTIKLCKEIDKELTAPDVAGNSTPTWTQNHMSIFADDKHCFWEIHSCKDFEAALKQLQIILRVIAESGMKVNFQKSVATIALKGQQAACILKRFTKIWDGRKCLILRRDTQDILIPIEENMKYLGVILNYNQFELATAKHRCQQANISFAQLKNVLRVNGALSKAQRLRVYVTCVWPSLLYGIGAAGIRDAVFRTLQSTAAMHLRKILRTHERGWVQP